MWWLLPVITCPEETRWEDWCEMEASLGYMNETSLDYRVRDHVSKIIN